MKREVLLALGCLLLGFGAGYVSPSLEQKPAPTSDPQMVTSPIRLNTGFALTACLGSEIPNARGGLSVIFEPGEC